MKGRKNVGEKQKGRKLSEKWEMRTSSVRLCRIYFFLTSTIVDNRKNLQIESLTSFRFIRSNSSKTRANT
jgi:hypothetical protein